MMKILLFGKSGLLGHAIFQVFQGHHVLTAPSHTECDLAHKEAVLSCVDHAKPDCIINAAGYAQVDKAEAEPEKAHEGNTEAVRNLVSAVAQMNIPLVNFSTDYVFDGKNSSGYKESDSPAPLSIYGKTKADAEKIIQKNLKNFYIVRTSWLFGPGGKNFVDGLLNKAEIGEPISVVNDQIGCPTFTKDLAQAVLHLIHGKAPGIYHIINDGSCSWYEFAIEIFNQLGIPQRIIPITTEQLNRPAKRPHYSILKNTKLPALRSWKSALAEYLMHKTILV